MPDLKSRYRGALLGLACGDAVGTTAEFSPRGSFAPLTDMVGGGPFALKPGQWTDDTSMALCLAESLLTKGAFDPADQMARYLNWWRWGYLSCTGECFDIGNTVRAALERFQITQQPYAGSTDAMSAGNGSLMRLAPVVMFAYPDVAAVIELAALSSRTTHGAPEALECCQLMANLMANCFAGVPKHQLFANLAFKPRLAATATLAKGRFVSKEERAIVGSGYCVASLEAALWCLFRCDDFASTILCAANLGDDADTTAAIAGQIAGAYYGVEQIPASWLQKLAMADDIDAMAVQLAERCGMAPVVA